MEIDPLKYLRESVAKYDMEQAITSPLPMPAGTKLYMDTGQHLNAEETNFLQQMTGTTMYAFLLRSELCYYASQPILSKLLLLLLLLPPTLFT